METRAEGVRILSGRRMGVETCGRLGGGVRRPAPSAWSRVVTRRGPRRVHHAGRGHECNSRVALKNVYESQAANTYERP